MQTVRCTRKTHTRTHTLSRQRKHGPSSTRGTEDEMDTVGTPRATTTTTKTTTTTVATAAATATATTKKKTTAAAAAATTTTTTRTYQKENRRVRHTH